MAKAVTTQAPDPEAWGLALLYANGDASRLRVSADGMTVTVRNTSAKAGKT